MDACIWKEMVPLTHVLRRSHQIRDGSLQLLAWCPDFLTNTLGSRINWLASWPWPSKQSSCLLDCRFGYGGQCVLLTVLWTVCCFCARSTAHLAPQPGVACPSRHECCAVRLPHAPQHARVSQRALLWLLV